jgi:hypothetical protein
MEGLRRRLVTAIRSLTPGEGYHPSPVSGVTCLKIYNPDLRTKRRWRACVAIVAQGEKEIVPGRGVYRIGAGDYSAAPVELPVVSRFAAASSGKPFLGLLVDLDPRILGEVAAALEKDLLGRPVRIIEHLFGIDFDAIAKRVRIAPHVPKELYGQDIAIENLILPTGGETRLAVRIRQTSDTVATIAVSISGKMPEGDLVIALPSTGKQQRAPMQRTFTSTFQ